MTDTTYDFSGLNALFINCTLKKSPEPSNTQGLVDASLAIRLENPKAVAAILAAAIPEKADQIRQGFAALALFGDKPSMPLRIVKGKASLGFIPLGRIEAVE